MPEGLLFNGPTDALFSLDRVYRYALWRRWSDGPVVAFLGLNPSTADEVNDDPTVRRCVGYAHDWGFGAMVMLNIFAFRSTNPKGLLSISDPVGKENDSTIIKFAGWCSKIVAAWGAWGSYAGRGAQVRALVREQGKELWMFGLTMNGQPKHPLYLAKTEKPKVWREVAP